MNLDGLRSHIATGDIDTVVVAFTDHYGRTLGKRFDAEFFLESLGSGSHACDYLLTVDMEMEPVDGYQYANWERGYGDFHLVADMTTLRRCGWAPNAAIVLCDIHDNAEHELVPVAPRSILRAQVAAAADAGFVVQAASELEFFLFRDSYREAHDKGYADLISAGWYNEDYHLLQGARVEDYVGAARRALRDSEIPVENSKGEAAIGQHELNIRYADVLSMADRHVVVKQAMKELAEQHGVAVTFMAKLDAEQSGSSCHLHLSLWSGDGDAAANVLRRRRRSHRSVSLVPGRLDAAHRRSDGVLCADCQLLQALPEPVLGTDEDRLEHGQQDRRVSGRRQRFEPAHRVPHPGRRCKPVPGVRGCPRQWSRRHRQPDRTTR